MVRTEPNIALADLEKVSTPTLVIVADHDFVTVEHAEAMQRALQSSRPEVVPDATHPLPLDKPDVVSRLVLDFLA